MCTEQDACTARAMNQVWRNQLAICETLHILAYWLAVNDHAERSVAVMEVAAQLINSDRVIEPALRWHLDDEWRQVQASQ